MSVEKEQVNDPEIQTNNSLQKKKNKRSSLDFRKYTKQIWLAGLGAFSRAEEEGNKLFDSLVKVGEELESKTTEVADQTIGRVGDVTEKAIERVTDTKDKVEKAIDQSVHHSLNRIGIVTPKDIQHLEQLILQLTDKVEQLTQEQIEMKAQLVKKTSKN